LERLLGEAENLAGRLSTLGPTLPLPQLSETTDRYSALLLELAEAEDGWLETLRSAIRASSA
jgi:hypothetical protein